MTIVNWATIIGIAQNILMFNNSCETRWHNSWHNKHLAVVLCILHPVDVITYGIMHIIYHHIDHRQHCHCTIVLCQIVDGIHPMTLWYIYNRYSVALKICTVVQGQTTHFHPKVSWESIMCWTMLMNILFPDFLILLLGSEITAWQLQDISCLYYLYLIKNTLLLNYQR